MRARLLLPLILAALGSLAACRTERETRAVVPYTTQVQPILAAQCLRCHAEAAPAGGFRADGYLGAIGCNGAGTAVTTATADGGAPLLVSVLERPDHAAYSTAADRSTLARWVATGTSRSGGGAHPAGFADPRSPESHGSYLRARRYAPLLDAEDVEACATCHGATGNAALGAGAPTAAGAPACSSCHQEADVAFSCTTCHGSGTAGGARSYPPRDPCFFPGAPAGAHAAHAEASAVRQSGLACTTCHPTPAKGDFGGHHANGSTEVWFDYALTGPTAYAAGEQRCTGSCHDHGGARPTPAWTDKGPLGCGDCHGAPPAGHYAGTCSTCHAEANADGTALTPGPLHINGKVDRGNGNGTCSACHGQGTSPWPTTGAHAAHANPKDAAPVPCESCHAVPAAGDRHPLGGGVVVRFAGLATTGARRATYDAATKTCSGTYCHESRGGQETTPAWTGTLTTGCTACHAAPPPAPHVQSATCGGSGCHEGRTDANGLTDLGRAGHVNGAVDRAY